MVKFSSTYNCKYQKVPKTTAHKGSAVPQVVLVQNIVQKVSIARYYHEIGT